MAELRRIIATDCGSTTTKAILIELGDDGHYHLVKRAEAPTTVEAPFEDVTIGVINAVEELEELMGQKYLKEDRSGFMIRGVDLPEDSEEGVDAYVSTSSAGGGLQMVVVGVVKEMTAESAQRAALGAGAIVMEVIAINDGRLPHERVKVLRQLRPDMILLAGGTDGGDRNHVVAMAEMISAANPKARLGLEYKLPVIFAGNKLVRDKIKEILGGKTALSVVDNIRPSLEKENLQPTRQKIQELFLQHVMKQAPGYDKLMKWTSAPIMPTPAAVGYLVQEVAKARGENVLGVDIGGATTDVFSVFDNIFNRTVSANYGMSYSISNVLAETGLENVMRWVPFDIDEEDLRNRVKNKMIRPTTIPQTIEELVVEQAIAREALRLSLEQHKMLAVGLKGAQRQRDIADTFTQTVSGETLIKMMKLDLIIGSGGVLSHAPRRVQSAMMMIDAFLPEGVTMLTVDSIFMMPHLGVLAHVEREGAKRAAMEVFDRDCLIRLGSCISPVGVGKEGEKCLTIEVLEGKEAGKKFEFVFGEIKKLPVELGVGERLKIKITPAPRYDVGAGRGRPLEAILEGGVVGVIVDTRGRPLKLPADKKERVARLRKWYKDLDLYPEVFFQRTAGGDE